MATTPAAFVCGLIFGIGLMLSGMAQPTKVLDFLDLFGTWDASLALVMAAALAISSAGFALAKRRPRPYLARQSQWPSSTTVDGSLIAGAILFGLGWGLVGLCPGPALVNLATFSPPVIVFVVAMGAGMLLHDQWSAHRLAAAAPITADG
jgi:uncharacterized membrane protein YedE/YeeE